MLSMQNICKSFYGVYANKKVNLQVGSGEIHALLGENGAGKTTLMNILYGLYTPDSGTILLEGNKVAFKSPKDAIAHRIGMVHQHFMLVPTLSVADNITLGLKEKGYPFKDKNNINRKIIELSEKYGLMVDPLAMIRSLSVGEQQRVEILKTLYRNTELLILDEPTAVLTHQEVEAFLSILRKLADNGTSVILITHKIPEVMKIADVVTVMRDAESIISVPITEVNETSLAKYMIDRELNQVSTKRSKREHPEAFVMQNVTLIEKGLQKIHDISLEIPTGSILGIAGVEGNGQKELAEIVLGIRKISTGTIRLYGQDITHMDVRHRRNFGLGYISDDRHRDGLLMDVGFLDNMLLKYNADSRFEKFNFINKKKITMLVREKVDEFKIKTSSLEMPVRFLSGGNQQKLILARELSDSPKLIVVNQPTRGLDIGASEFVRNEIVKHRDEGTPILLISADLEEILSISDRIAVIHKGEIMGVLENNGLIDITSIGLMMSGKTLCCIGEKGIE